MNEFVILYEKVKQNPSNKSFDNQCINKGMEIYNQTRDISIKEFVLYLY